MIEPALAFCLILLCMKKRRVGYLFAFYYMGIESRIYVMKDLVSLAAWDMIWMRNVLFFRCRLPSSRDRRG